MLRRFSHGVAVARRVLGGANGPNPAAAGWRRFGQLQQHQLPQHQLQLQRHRLQRRLLGTRPIEKTIQAKTNRQKEHITTFVDSKVAYFSGAEFKADVLQVVQVFSFWFIQSSLWFIVIRNYVVDVVPCNGPSMLPTVAQQDFLLAAPLTLWVRKMMGDKTLGIEKGDVVLSISPQDPDKKVCKRVMGLAGDSVRVGNPLFYDMRSPEYMTVPRGHVWLLGDNATDSNDSRMYGPVALGLVLNKVIASVKPGSMPTLIECDPDYGEEARNIMPPPREPPAYLKGRTADPTKVGSSSSVGTGDDGGGGDGQSSVVRENPAAEPNTLGDGHEAAAPAAATGEEKQQVAAGGEAVNEVGTPAVATTPASGGGGDGGEGAGGMTEDHRQTSVAAADADVESTAVGGIRVEKEKNAAEPSPPQPSSPPVDSNDTQAAPDAVSGACGGDKEATVPASSHAGSSSAATAASTASPTPPTEQSAAQARLSEPAAEAVHAAAAAAAAPTPAGTDRQAAVPSITTPSARDAALAKLKKGLSFVQTNVDTKTSAEQLLEVKGGIERSAVSHKSRLSVLRERTGTLVSAGGVGLLDVDLSPPESGVAEVAEA